MKKYLLLVALLITLSGCAFGVYGGRGFHGAAIYEGHYHRHDSRPYSYSPGHYYRDPGYRGYYR